MDGQMSNFWHNHPETEVGFFVPKTVQRHFALPLKMMQAMISQFPSFSPEEETFPFQKPIRAAGSSLHHSSLWTALNGAKGAVLPARRNHHEFAPT